MNVKKYIKKLLKTNLEILKTNRAKQNEIRKFKNSKRKEIYSKIKFSKKRENKINNYFKTNYGRKIPLTWHRHYTAYTGKFDLKYFPELLYIPEFEHYMNYNTGLASVLEDKNLLEIFADYANVKMPKKILSCQEGLFRDANESILTLKEAEKYVSNIGECFIKPSIGTCSGIGCQVLNLIEGNDLKTNRSIKEILDDIGLNFVLQERIICSESIRKIYDKSVNTFRIMTYRWKDEIIVCPVVMRIGQKESFLDNAHAGGMFIAVDNDGKLHEKAFTEFKEEFIQHPDTKLKFKDYRINSLDKVIDKVKRMHYLIPTIGVINWDMTINENEDPVLIEANINGGGIWIFQMAHGCGVFGENTTEILQWLKYVKKHKNAHFGKMDA